ncbi:hypothetical protein NSPZN2_70071 [Nitrospira defluvii]|uniref:Uncharacterized protein n=1 Tax=Nitrospira defluvii TaxID=330214 RepID=A0ABN7MEZ6_9BACT|nr:hypothetical protein NSPZN2_70071 [Nitrospira defluvii]
MPARVSEFWPRRLVSHRTYFEPRVPSARVDRGAAEGARGFLERTPLSVPLSTMPGGFHECDRHHHQRDCPTHTRIELHP